MEEEQEEIVYSTKGQLEEFKDSLIWKDIKGELNFLYTAAQLEYNLVGESKTSDDGTAIPPTTAETLIHLGDIKGRIKAVSSFLSIIDVIITKLEVMEDGTGHDKAD